METRWLSAIIAKEISLILQSKEEIFINQAKYIRDLLKRFDMGNSKLLSNPITILTKLDGAKQGTPLDAKIIKAWLVLYLTIGRP